MARLATDNSGAENISTEANIGVAGCHGRVGSLIVKELQSKKWGPNINLSGGTIKPGYPHKNDFFVSDDPDELFECSDVVIDFTTPDATSKHIWLAAKHHKALIIGTTGLNEAQEQEIADAAKETAIVYASNMSVGITLLTALIEQTATRLGPEYDIEISEIHHKHKIDAPSGTALALGKAVSKGRKIDLEENAIYERQGVTGERSPGEIGFSVQRGGDVVGEHSVTFFGEGERLVFTHKATDRTLFAKGAIRAALWVKTQGYGLYSMQDVLSL